MSNLYFAGEISGWVILLAVLAIFVFLIYQFLTLRQRLGARRSGLLIFLRALVYGLLILFLFSPSLLQKRTTRLRHSLALLIDISKSMAFSESAQPAEGGKQGKSRLDEVKEKLLAGKEPLIERLRRDYDLRLFQFGAGLEPIGPESISRLGADGKGTRLLEALQEAGQSAPAGIILLSDGIANGEIKSIGESGSLTEPVFAVGVGETKGYTDLRITDLHVPQFAFRGRELKFDFTVQAYGLAGKTVPLYFNRGKNLVSSRSIAIDRDPFEQRVTLAYTPKEIGPQSFTVSVPPQPGEFITQNNQTEFRIDVQRDKLRVLTLSGSPSWNYRFLRMALKQDPLIDLVSFVFLRTPTNSVDVPDNQLSLIPFPIDEIFLEELKNFDVLIFDNFSYRSYFNMLYLEKVRDFVRNGGGFAMLGGSRSFDSGGYGDSPLRELLPVELNGKGSYQTGARLSAALAAAGKAHPITRLLADPRANERAWKEMPPLTSLNRILRAKGETLLVAGLDGSDGASPLLTVGRSGKGRTLALMSDDFWRWNFVAVGEKESPQNHLKLIRQAIRWLAQEPSFEQVQIEPLGGSRNPGEKINFKVRVLKDDFTPASNAAVRLRLIGPEGEPFPLEASAQAAEGEYGAEFTPTREGSYQLEAEATLSGRLLGKDRKGFLVAFPYGETEDGRPRPDFLKQIAEKSHGEFIPISEWNEKSLERIAGKLEKLHPSEIVEQSQVRLSSTLWTFVPILLLLGSEWWARRKWGLI